MNIATLQSYFTRSKRTKLYIADPEFLLAGFASNPQEEGEKLVLDIGPYVSYGSAGLLVSDRAFHLVLSDADVITRRYNTHLRHARARSSEMYLQLAKELSDEPLLYSGAGRVILPTTKD